MRGIRIGTLFSNIKTTATAKPMYTLNQGKRAEPKKPNKKRQTK